MSDEVTLIEVRQGDLLLRQIRQVPAGLSPLRTRRKKGVKKADARIVLLEGELTGHNHTIPQEGVRFYQDSDGGMFFTVTAQAPIFLTHDEHAPIQIAPATSWEVVRQKEYEYGQRTIRDVAD